MCLDKKYCCYCCKVVSEVARHECDVSKLGLDCEKEFDIHLSEALCDQCIEDGCFKFITDEEGVQGGHYHCEPAW